MMTTTALQKPLRAIALGVALSCIAMPASASVPGQINFQGLLLDALGQPSNGMVDMGFSLYPSASTGSALWTETHTDVPVLDGVYDVVLGSTNPIGSDVLEGGSLYLEVQVEGETLSPRQRLLAVPYALRAQVAETSQSVTAPVAQVPNANVITAPDLGNDAVHTSITLGADGLPVLAYNKQTPGGGLRVLKCGDPSCSTGNIATSLGHSGSDVEYTSIAIGTDGFPVIAYAVDGLIYVAKCSDAACAGGATLSDLHDLSTRHSSIAVGLDGRPFVAYADQGNNLTIVRCGNAACSSGNSSQSISTTVGKGISIAVDFDGRAVVAYHDEAATRLNLIYCDSPACTSTSGFFSEDGGLFPSMTIGDDGNPVVAHFAIVMFEGDDNYSLQVSRCGAFVPALPKNCLSPTTSSVALAGEPPDGFVGRATGLTLGLDGAPLVSYLSTEGNADPFLKLAKCSNLTCSSTRFISVIDSLVNQPVGYYHGLTVGADGRPVLSYRHEDFGGLKVMRCANSLCVSNWTRR